MPISLITAQSYPLNGTTTFPIGEEILLKFDQLVDEKTAKESIVLLKAVNNEIIETDVSVYAVDGNNIKNTNPFLEKPVSQTTVVSVKPKNLLDANTKFELHVRGKQVEEVIADNAEFKSIALSERTIFNTSKGGELTEQVRVYGTYSELNTGHLNIEIVSGGEGSGAKYIWWFSNEGKPQASGSRLNRTVSRWRNLDRGCYIKFYGGEYTVGDVYQVNVYPKVLLENSYKIEFSTSSEDLVLKPAVEAESDIGVNLPALNLSANTDTLKIIDMQPRNGSINNSKELNKIVITFNKDIDATTVSQENIVLFKQSVSGFFNGKDSHQKMPKEIIIENNKIILEF